MRKGRYKTTEAKRYLGKLLFHDPVRTARINVNKSVNPPIRTGEPRDLPDGTAFGGTVPADNPNVGSVVATPTFAAPGTVVQQWMCDAVVLPRRPAKLTWTLIVNKSRSTVTSASPVAGGALDGISAKPVSIAPY